jgi:hypothetical protein
MDTGADLLRLLIIGGVLVAGGVALALLRKGGNG